jgi:hypothetical protein
MYFPGFVFKAFLNSDRNDTGLSSVSARIFQTDINAISAPVK